MAKTTTTKKAAPKKTEAKKAPAKKQPAKSKQAPKEEALTQEFIEDIEEQLASFKEELNKARKNASAAKRARKHTTELAKKFKEFRKASIAHHRKE